MGVRTIKIGFASGQGGHDRKDSTGSAKSGNHANMIEPFPASSIEPFPAPKIPPLGKQRLPTVPPARYDNMVLHAARVKSVLSGDSLVLQSVANPERERTLSLAYCTSPHLKKEGDEQWAFESRDALRQLVVGKIVNFNVLYTIPNTKREYGIVILPDSNIHLPEEMVKQGWLKLREDAGRKEDSEEALQQLDRLRLLEATARSEDKGLWQPNGERIEVLHDMGDTQAFLDTWKGKTIDGIVERVLSGDRMLVRLLISPKKHIQGVWWNIIRFESFSWLTNSSHDVARRNPCSYHRTCQPLERANSTCRGVWKCCQIVC
jgi:staphylococcal nuclease domain-containing protein 1